MDCMAHSMPTLTKTCNRIQTHRSSASRWIWATYVVNQAGFAWRRSDIGKPTPAGLDQLKISLWWRVVIMQLKSGIATTAQLSDVRVLKWLLCKDWLSSYGATSCAWSYRWPGRPRQLSLQCMARLHQSPGKVQRCHERVEERIRRYLFDAGELPDVS